MSRPIPVEEIVGKFIKSHKNCHIFKIDNFSLLGKYEIKECESSVFEIRGHKWKLIVYPNGNEIENGKGYISLYLEIQDSGSLPPNWKVKIQFQLFILTQFSPGGRGEKVSGVFYATNTRQGAARLISLVEFGDSRKGYLVDDCALFGMMPYGVQDSTPATADCFTLIEKPPNHRVTWKMRFSAFDRYTKYQSHEFVVGNRKWRIEVNPRGLEEEKGDSFSVFLSGEGFVDNTPKAKTYARYKLRVLDQTHGNHIEKTSSYWFPLDPEGYGFRRFMPLKDLHDPSMGYLVDDRLYVGVEIEVISVSKYC